MESVGRLAGGYRPRLQQPPDGDHRARRPPPPRACRRTTPAGRRRGDQRCRRPRGHAHAAVARVRSPDAAATRAASTSTPSCRTSSRCCGAHRRGRGAPDRPRAGSWLGAGGTRASSTRSSSISWSTLAMRCRRAARSSSPPRTSSSTSAAAAEPRGVAAGTVRHGLRQRHREWASTGHARADLRAVLHDQGSRARHRARAGDRVRDRGPVRGATSRCQYGRRGHDLPDPPAAASRAEAPDAGGDRQRPGTHRWARNRPCSPRTRSRSAVWRR
jgi:hypothetical protein